MAEEKLGEVVRMASQVECGFPRLKEHVRIQGLGAAMLLSFVAGGHEFGFYMRFSGAILRCSVSQQI